MSGKFDNRLRSLEKLGQSLWLDYIERGLLTGGEMERLIRDDGISGVTSNPSIFENAIAQHAEYDETITKLSKQGLDAQKIYEELAIDDVRRAADLLHGVYESSGKRDGYVSLEVSPHLAYDTDATVAEAKRLWGRVARPNLMIKVPSTLAGLPAIRQLIAAGINVNATLLFSDERFFEVSESYLDGLEDRLKQGEEIDHIASVASFFLSRIDTLVDHFLDQNKQPQDLELRGQTAIACARLAYREYKKIVASARWKILAAQGARTQRLLWASTSTKNPAYEDVMYVEALIGPDTVNTITLETLSAYRDHGDPQIRLEENLVVAYALPERLAALGLSFYVASDELENQGVQKFIDSYERLLVTLARRATELMT